MPDPVYRSDGSLDEAASRGQTRGEVADPSSALIGGWYGRIGNSTMYLGGLRPDATPEEAAAYYAKLPDNGLKRGLVDPSVFDAANPNATPEERKKYETFYNQTQEQINRSPMDGTLTTALGGPLG